MLAKNRRILVRAPPARLGFGSANRLRGQVEASGTSVQPITASAFGRFALIDRTSARSGHRQLPGGRAGDEPVAGLETRAASWRSVSCLFPGSQQLPCQLDCGIAGTTG